MSEEPPEFVLRRIVVAVDASAYSLAAIEAAAELAGRTQAEVLGLFVEDINLIRLARLPFAREVSRPAGIERTLGDLEAEIRALAAQARRALESAAERLGFRASFRVVRGSVRAEVLAAAAEADLLILGWAGHPVGTRARLGGTARAAAEQALKPVLLVRRGGSQLGPVAALYDGSAGAKRALRAAVVLCRAGAGELTVVLLAERREEAAALRKGVESRLEGLPAQFRLAVGSREGRLATSMREAGQGLLVLSADSPRLGGDATRRIVEERGGPVLLVR